jgi:hypothetical protein
VGQGVNVRSLPDPPSHALAKDGHQRMSPRLCPPALKPGPVANQPTAQPDECDEPSEVDGLEHARADQDPYRTFSADGSWNPISPSLSPPWVMIWSNHTPNAPQIKIFDPTDKDAWQRNYRTK